VRRKEAELTRSSIRLWFCLAVAVLAAAVADPLVEAASNAGWFGPGTFTDRSSLDVLPALCIGCAFAIVCLVLRVRLLRLSNEALGSHPLTLLPAILATQLGVLFCMETAEQYVVWGHTFGGTIWLGGPVAVSLAVHAATCVAVTLIAARSIRSLATAAVRVIRLIEARAVRRPGGRSPLVARSYETVPSSRCSLAPRTVGERAPPLPA